MLMTIHALGGADQAALMECLSDPEEHTRTWAVRLLLEGVPVSPDAIAAFQACAAKESSGLVLTYLASALQKITAPADRFALASAISSHAEFAEDMRPLDEQCECYTCTHFSRAYLRHLFQAGEMTAAILISHHNVYFFLDTMRRVRESIKTRSFQAFRTDFLGKLTENASDVV